MTTPAPEDTLTDLVDTEVIALALALALSDSPDGVAHTVRRLDRPQLDRLATAAAELSALIRGALDVPQPGTPETDRDAAVARLGYAAAELVGAAERRADGARVSERHLAAVAAAVDELSPGLVGRIAAGRR